MTMPGTTRITALNINRNIKGDLNAEKDQKGQARPEAENARLINKSFVKTDYCRKPPERSGVSIRWLFQIRHSQQSRLKHFAGHVPGSPGDRGNTDILGKSSELLIPGFGWGPRRIPLDLKSVYWDWNVI